MKPQPEWVYRACQVLYGLVLLLGTGWNLKRLYDNDRAGQYVCINPYAKQNH